MLKLLKQKIGFSWKTGWERFPTPRKISEISGDFYPFHKLWKTLLKVFGKSVENRKNGLKSAHFLR